jgi:hypothetical protein
MCGAKLRPMAGHELADLPLNCPRCGRPLRYVRARTPDGRTLLPEEAATPATVYIYYCFEHGPFRLRGR